MKTTNLPATLARRPLGLAFDIDGTLSPIARTSSEARLYPGVAALLERMKTKAHIAIATGRAIEDGAAMVGVEDLTYIGVHGLEWSGGLPSTHPVQIVPEALAYTEAGTQLLDLVESHLADLPGVYLQRKSVGGSIHYRLASDPAETRQKILALLAEPTSQLHMLLSEGKRIVEIKPPLPIHKGYALRRFVEHFHLQSIVFAGDDRTDLDAVLEIQKLRAEGKSGFAIVVQHDDTLPDLLTHADLLVQGVEGMVKLLQEIAEML